MNEAVKQRWGVLQWGIVTGIVLLVGLWVVPTWIEISRIGNEVRAVSYSKQILLGMKQFSNDNGGLYPDGGPSAAGLSSSNQFFRRLLQVGVFTEETVFGCPGSRFTPDGRIGTAPDFRQALEPGECHWIVLKHQANSSPGDVPVIVENALDTNWPPRWDVSEHAGNRKGRVRAGKAIVVACNDGSVQVVKLQEDGSLDARLWNRGVTPEQAAKLSYWDIEEK